LKNKILIIDDDEELLQLLKENLGNDFIISTATNADDGLKQFKAVDFGAALVDVVLPDRNGIDVLKEMRNMDSNFPIVVITGHASIDLAVRAMKIGAFYFVEKPISPKALKEILKRAIEQSNLLKDYQSLRKLAEEKYSFSGILGKSKPMQEIFSLIERVASAEATILIEGETGTGKELVAKAIHFNSLRKENRFLAINCGALPESLLESELFGYAAGVFTGANKNKEGLLEVANSGTIFLDEIAQTPIAFQSKVLRVLEKGTFYPVGSTEEKITNTRIIAATDWNIEEAVEEGKFREDLFYRLSALKIHLPPLRERKGDIPLLSRHFLDIYAKKNHKEIKDIGEEVLEVLVRYSWPGNVRELENAIERAVILCQDNTILPENLPERVVKGEEQEPSNIANYDEAKEVFEKKYLRNLLKVSAGNVSKSAKAAGMTRQNIYIKLRKYNINPKIYYPRK